MTPEQTVILKEFHLLYDNLKSDYKKVSQKLEVAKAENQMLYKQIDEYKDEKMEIKSCLNCKEQYSNFLNSEVNSNSIF